MSSFDDILRTLNISELIKIHLFITQSKIFQNESVLLDDYLPETLLHREADIKRFSRYCKGIIKPQLYQRSFYPFIVKGGSGTGKTTLTKLSLNTNEIMLTEQFQYILQKVSFSGLLPYKQQMIMLKKHNIFVLAFQVLIRTFCVFAGTALALILCCSHQSRFRIDYSHREVQL